MTYFFLFSVRFRPGRARFGYPVIGRVYGCLGKGFPAGLDPALFNRSTAMRPFLVRTSGLLLARFVAAGVGTGVVVLVVCVVPAGVEETVLIAGLESPNVGEGILSFAGFVGPGDARGNVVSRQSWLTAHDGSREGYPQSHP